VCARRRGCACRNSAFSRKHYSTSRKLRRRRPTSVHRRSVARRCCHPMRRWTSPAQTGVSRRSRVHPNCWTGHSPPTKSPSSKTDHQSSDNQLSDIVILLITGEMWRSVPTYYAAVRNANTLTPSFDTTTTKGERRKWIGGREGEGREEEGICRTNVKVLPTPLFDLLS